MKAIVLVGGRGTRLRPLTLTVPKQMLPVSGRPMVEHVVEHLAGHGVDEVVLSLGYRPDAFRDAYPDGVCAGLRMSYAVELEPLDTAGAIAFAARRCGVTDTFVVVNGDVLTDLDVTALVDFHRRSKAQASIALTPVEDPSSFGVVVTDPDGRVQAFVEKPPLDQAPSKLVNAGTYVLEPSAIDAVPTDARMSIERQLFPQLAATRTLYAKASEARWADIGTPAKYLEANLQGAKTSNPAPGATVERSEIGAGVTFGAGAQVTESVLLDGVQIGAGAVVRRSLLGWGARVGDGATVEGLSVLGAGFVVPPGEHLDGAIVPDVLDETSPAPKQQLSQEA